MLSVTRLAGVLSPGFSGITAVGNSFFSGTSASTCGATFAAFISLGSSKVAIRLVLCAYPTRN